MPPVLGRIGLSLPLMMAERKIIVDTHLLCLSELRESSIDNCSKRHSFRLAFLIKWCSSVQFGLSATSVLSRFCCAAANLHVNQHFFQPSLLINAWGCCLRGQKPVDCCVMTCSLPACLHDSHINCLLAMFMPNVHQIALLAFIWPCGCALSFRRLIICLLTMFGHFWAKQLSARVNSTWRQFYLAFWPHPLTVIFLWPCGHAPTWQNWFSIGLTMTVLFYFFPAPSQQNWISIHLTVIVKFILLPPPRGNIPFAPHSQPWWLPSSWALLSQSALCSCQLHLKAIFLALWPRPLTMIFFWPCDHAPSRQKKISIGLTMNVDFYFSSALSWWNWFSMYLMANVNFYFLQVFYKSKCF